MRILILFILISPLIISCKITKSQNLAVTSKSDYPLAFPTAEGFGKYTTGGRGGKIMIVTNLNDDGAGSFREAATYKTPRVIVFAVSGTIHLKTRINILGNCTIAGQSAPGDGICIADKTVGLGGNNIIVRYMRFRMGDKYANEGMIDGAGGDDAFGGTHRNNIIIDHCSMSWSEDEVFSVYGGDSTTLQWNIISEPLNYSYHFETGDKDFEHHGYGGIWGGKHLTGHHNIFAHCKNRTPRYDGIRNIPEENADFRNNVIYNWGENNLYAGEGGTYNIVNNYYKQGPNTSKKVMYRIANPFKKEPAIPFGKFYINGNYIDASPENSADNWKAVDLEKGTADEKIKAKINAPFLYMNVQTESAEKAYTTVLANAGCNLPVRDTLDERIVNDVKKRTGNIIDVQGNYPHGTPYEKTVNAWPFLKTLPAFIDTDKDGMPDAWEKKNGLDSADPADAATYKLNKFYTNIEVYLNSLTN
jgi:pectate lyase